MTIEQNIAEMLEKKLKDGTVEKAIEEKLTKCISECVDDMFRWSGDAKKIIEEKLKETMIPAIEKHSFSKYTVKLDSVLTELVKTTALQDNKSILGNFQKLMSDVKEEISVTDIYQKWMEYVEENVETSGLDINYDDGVSYDYVEVSMEVEEIEDKSKYAPAKVVVRFECEHDTDMNFQFEMYKYDFMKGYEIQNYAIANINSIKNLTSIQIFLLQLSRNCTKIKIDAYQDESEVLPKAEPEASFS